MDRQICIFLTFTFALALTLTGCASAPEVITVEPLPVPIKIGIYHCVSEGETLWRIAKSYNIEISRLALTNNISDPSRIDAGQMLFIPDVAKKIEIPAQTATVSEGGFIWPVQGEVISYFGQKRHNIINQGIDISAYENAAVVASKDGVVSFCDDRVKGFGKTIIVEHKDGYSTVYAYNSKNLVKPGDRINRGQVIALAGRSSRSDRYALHFEVRKGQKPKNPFYYLP